MTKLDLIALKDDAKGLMQAWVTANLEGLRVLMAMKPDAPAEQVERALLVVLMVRAYDRGDLHHMTAVISPWVLLTLEGELERLERDEAIASALRRPTVGVH